jgi:hypothetical protein
MIEEPLTPMTWNAEGKLVPLDERERARLRAESVAHAASNPPLPENRVLTFRETLDLLLLDIAHMIDSVFRPPENVPIFVAAQPPAIALILLVFLLRFAWFLLVPIVVAIILFRLWVWLAIEKKPRQFL